MDQFTEDDQSRMMDSVGIPTSELSCVNSVSNSVQDTHCDVKTHDGEDHNCSERDQLKSDPAVNEHLFGAALDPAFLTVSSLEDYSDVSSSSEADFGCILNILGKNSDQYSECHDTGHSGDKNELEKDFLNAGRHDAWAPSDKATENQDDICKTSETEGEGQQSTVDNVTDGDDHVEMSLNLEDPCSNLSTIESENGCPLKTEEQVKEGFLVQNTDCGVAERSRNCQDTATAQTNSLCAVNLNSTTISSASKSGPDDCHLPPGISNNCEIKNNASECELKNDGYTVHDTEPMYDTTGSSQEVEHSSFEFLESCFGLNSIDHVKLDQNAAFPLSESMTPHSQSCEVNPTETPVLVKATFESVTRDQMKEQTNDCLQVSPIPSTYSSISLSQQQIDSIEDQIITGLSRTESTHDAKIIKSASLLSSKKLVRILQPVVLVKTTLCNAKDGLYVCSKCQKSKQNLDELIEHHHCNHTNQTLECCLTCGAYICNGTLATQHVCEQIGPNDMQMPTILSIPKQMTGKNNVKYLCKYCEKPFVKKAYYKDHVQRHVSVTRHRCDCCGLYFANAQRLAAHKRKVKCSPMILDPSKQRKKSSKGDQNLAKPAVTVGVDGHQIGLQDCFVKLVDIKSSPQKINCSICGKGFKLRAQLKVHLRSHTGAKPFECNKCKKIFKYSWNLDKHKKDLCSGKQQMTEPSNTGSFHERFPCPTCPKRFVYSYNRTRHMRQLCLNHYIEAGKGKVENRYKCPLCSETFSFVCNRNRHLKTTCFQQWKWQRLVTRKNLVKEKKEEKQVLRKENLRCYKCKVCPVSFTYKSGLYKHMKKHSLRQYSSVPAGKNVKPTAVKGSVPNNERPQRQENSNEKSTDMVTNQPFQCEFCDKRFSSENLLNNHLRLHGGKKPFQCLDCGKTFGRRGHLITHKKIHKRRIQCSVCKKIVPTIGDLLKHRQSHIKKGMLKCPDCPMQFKFPVYLLRHVASHAKKEAMLKSSTPAETTLPTKSTVVKFEEFKEPLNCGICRKTFVDSKKLSEHCLTHLPEPSDLKCPVCKHNFTNRTALVRHVRLHTGEKPFSCKTCGMPFHRKEALMVHQEKCKGLQEKRLSPSSTSQTDKKSQIKTASVSKKVPKKFPCSYCPHVFNMSGNLTMHEKAHLANSLLPCLKCGKYFKKKKIYEHRKTCNAMEPTSGEKFNSAKFRKTKSELQDASLDAKSRKCRRTSTFKDRLKERCPHCSKRFQYRSYLLRHLPSHMGKKHFSCKHCGEKYGSQSSCKRHEAVCDGLFGQKGSKRLNGSEESATSLMECMVILGENGEQLKCNFCTKTFIKPRSLRRHILTHTEVKPYRCKACENCFSRYDHLKHHQTRCRGKKQQLVLHLEKIPLGNVGSHAKRQPQSAVFNCNICSKTFSTETNLTRHTAMLHSDFKPFSCDRCSTGFSSMDSMRRHNMRANCKISSPEFPKQMKLNKSVQPCRETSKLMQRIEGHYSNKWKFPCEYCPRRFKTQSQVQIHTRLHTGEKPFGCSKCDERFIRKDYLKRHITKCNGAREGPKVLCDRCGGLFTKAALETHQNSCTISLKFPDCPVGVSSISRPSKVKAFSCLHCSDHFLLFSQLQQHILTKHRSEGLQQLSRNLPIKEEPGDERYAENLQSSHPVYANNGYESTDKEREKPFECEYCKMRFITNSGLGMHVRTHTAVYPLSCHKCKKGFWSKNVQQKHMRKCKGLEATVKEPPSKELECPPNDKVLVFNKGSNATGTGVLQTKFSCKDQYKANVDRGDAAVHKYQCSECEQSFTDGLMLISHLEAHGREDQERRLGKGYHCHICGKTFDQAGMLHKHMKTSHQETVKNTCPDCNKNFRYPSDLNLHRSCHDPNRPFVCSTCKLRFWTPKSLTAHQRIVHPFGEPFKTIEPTLKTDMVSRQVFTCHPCDKMYTVKGSYIKHMNVKHKGWSKTIDDLKGAAPTEHQMRHNESDGSDADEQDASDDSDSAPYFPCHVCGKTFVTSESLEDHQRCHLGEKPHECEECGKCFIQLCNLQQHQRSHKSEFQCQLCGKGFVSLFALRKHKSTHGGRHTHRCTKCHLSFTQSSQLAEHMTTHRDENFPCDLCHENFSCKSSRAEHRKMYHTDEELPPLIPPAKQTSPPPVTNSPSLGTVQQYSFSCEICQFRFPDPEQLTEHGCSPAIERPYSCKDCNKHFLHGSHLKKHQLTHQLSGTQSFQCNSCHMSFNHRHHFLTHLQTHGGEESSKSQIEEAKVSNTDDSNQDKIYRCPICPECFSQVLELANHLSVHANMCNVCNKTFSTKQQLEKHEQCHLSAATQYECTECGKSFLGSDAFRQHYCVHQKRLSSLSTANKRRRLENSSEIIASNEEEEEVDVGEDFYNCPTCNKRFPSNVSLQEHQKLHAFDRPFKCLVCGKGFTKRRYLTQHQQIHNERPYQCDFCPSSFKTEPSLLSHRKTHDVHRIYHCSVCDKSYRTPYDLAKHEQKHHELQNFSEVSGDHRCDMCYKSFSQLSQLRQHQETHVGQVVYECTECDKAFAFLHLLEEHQQTHASSANSYQTKSPSDMHFQCPVME